LPIAIISPIDLTTCCLNAEYARGQVRVSVNTSDNLFKKTLRDDPTAHPDNSVRVRLMALFTRPCESTHVPASFFARDGYMLAVGFLFTSTISGLSGTPLWVAVLCGLGLAAIGISEKAQLSARSAVLGRIDVLSLAAMGSLMIGQLASVGTFAAGRLLGALLIG
jgi:hypothetical protein